MSVFETIAAQQGKERTTAVWMVGEQLKEILRREPRCEELVERDMERGMSLGECEKRISEYAKANRTGDFACVTPAVAEEIIRNYFGLPTPQGESKQERPMQTQMLNLEDFF